MILKMLHLSDLHELQRDVNTLISLAQEFTANPYSNILLNITKSFISYKLTLFYNILY